MTREGFFEILSDVDGELVAEAAERPKRRRVPRRAALIGAGALAACLVLAAVWLLPRAAPDDGGTGGSGGGAGTLPGGILPELMVDGRIFCWAGMAGDEAASGDAGLPAGYAEHGEILSVTRDAPAGDGQLRAGFDATGTIYTSQVTPEAVYVRMTTSWYEDKYVRFVSGEILNGSRIRWEGRDYKVMVWQGACVRELPEGCGEIGTVHFVGRDALPQNDLETNCPGDDWCRTLEGRTVYAGPAGTDVLYICETGWWREGSFDAWIPCIPWEDAMEELRQQLTEMGSGPESPWWPE